MTRQSWLAQVQSIHARFCLKKAIKASHVKCKGLTHVLEDDDEVLFGESKANNAESKRSIEFVWAW